MTPDPAPSRYIELLGGVRVDGISISGEKTAGLLALLALDPGSGQTRERLADLFWPHLPPHRTRRALTDGLYRLRALLGPESLLATPTHVSLNPAAARSDVAEFERLIALDDEPSLKRAVSLYAGPLAPELYDDWILPRREALNERYLAALLRLGKLAESEGQFGAALDYFQTLAGEDPLREEAHRGIMRAQARLGRPADALATYDRLEALLRDELDVPPADPTRHLAYAIRAELEIQRQRPAAPARSPFVGRVAERAAALEQVEAMIAGRGGALAVEGPPGMGKSRLWDEIAAGASWRGATVLRAAAADFPTSHPLEPLRDWLQQALAGPRAEQVALLMPDEIVTALSELYPPWRGRTSLPELPLPQAKARLARSLAVAFRTLAGLSPYLLVLDDAQWATPALWETIGDLLDGIRDHRLLVGLAYSRPDIEATTGWSHLQKLEREGALSVLALPPLTPAEVARLMPGESRDEADTVYVLSGGNPFYVNQAVMARHEGTMASEAGRILESRLAAMPPAERAALGEAAVLGQTAPIRLWASISAMAPAALIAAADRLAAYQLLVPIAGGYAFAGDLIHAAAYVSLPPEARQLLHERAAAAVREQDPANPHALAFHLDRAGQTAAAAEAYRAAGRLDLAAFAFAEARSAFERALALLPDDQQADNALLRVETLFDIAAICDSTGDRLRQRSALEEALGLAHWLETDAHVMRALVGLGRLAAVSGQVDEAARHLDAALSLVGNVDDESLVFDAHFYRGDLAARRGRLDPAREQFGLALDVARRASAPINEARAMRGLGIVARLNGDPTQAMALVEQALALQMAVGDLYGASVTHTNRLAALYDLGAWDRLLTFAGEALALKERLGDRHGAAIVRHMQGLAALSLGDPYRAHALMEEAERGFIAVQDRRTAGLARNVLGLVAESRGRLDEAQADYEAALRTAEATGATTEAAYARHDLGALLVRVGRPEDAAHLLEAARAIWLEQGNALLSLKSEAWLGLALLKSDPARAAALAEHGWQAFQSGVPAGEMPQAWLWALHQLLEALQRPIEARSALDAAYAEIGRQADALADTIQRGYFFQRVPQNAAIVAAHDRAAAITRRVTRTIARAGGPPIMVTWTVSAPEDELVADPAQRRRQVLARLLAEAAGQGAAPTDDDLAAALGVSRRTIIRDRQALSRAGHPPSFP